VRSSPPCFKQETEPPREYLDLEELTEKDLERIKARYETLARKAREDLERGLKDTEPIEVQTD
jgi:hypothetical protein